MSESDRSVVMNPASTDRRLRSVKAIVMRDNRPGEALAGAVQGAGLVEAIESMRVRRGLEKQALRIAVKLDLAYPVDAIAGKSIVVGAEVAVALSNILEAAGYAGVRFMESRIEARGASAQPVQQIAKRHGYPATVIDRLIDLVDDGVELDLGSTVGKELVGRDWVDADVRIVLGKNRTHSSHLLWGAFGALLGCYARADRLSVLRQGGRALAPSAVLINARVPTHFAILDAWVSGDGSAGDLRPGPVNETGAILASAEPLATDWLAAELMGLDPGLSPFLREAMLRSGVLHLHRIGNLTPWTPWRNVSLFGAAISQVMHEPKSTGGPDLQT